MKYFIAFPNYIYYTSPRINYGFGAKFFLKHYYRCKSAKMPKYQKIFFEKLLKLSLVSIFKGSLFFFFCFFLYKNIINVLLLLFVDNNSITKFNIGITIFILINIIIILFNYFLGEVIVIACDCISLLVYESVKSVVFLHNSCILMILRISFTTPYYKKKLIRKKN